MKRVGLATGTLTDYEVNQIETQIVKTVRPMLIGRQLMPSRVLASAGTTQYTYYTENDMGQAMLSMTGEEQSMDAVDLTEGHVHIPIISKDYMLHWREVVKRRDSGEDLNTQHAENAARQVAEEEDKLILTGEYTGWPALGILGLLTSCPGANAVAGQDWTVAAGAGVVNAVEDTAHALQHLRAAGHQGPYKMIMPSAVYAYLEALFPTPSDKWGFEGVGELIGGTQNILISDNLFAAAGSQDSVLLLDVQPGNFELLMGADITNYLAQLPTMNYQGKVWEAVVPVIKRPYAIAEINTVLS
jgi:uncharacterized linocin/CFP29 family protein